MNKLFVLSGPSGVGKGTIAKKLLENFSNLTFSISCTTRLPRPHETDGVDYYFITKDEFISKIENNGFLEYNVHFDNYYGTPIDKIKEQLKTKNVLLDIDVNGGLNVKKVFDNAVLIMLLPPSKDALKERLLNRNTETAETIAKRLKRYEYELSKQEMYDYVVINDNLDDCLTNVIKIINENK